MKLAAYRKSKGITQQQFAELVGRSQGTVSSWEGGQMPDGPALRRIFEVTGGTVTPNDFLDLPGDLPGDPPADGVAA